MAAPLGNVDRHSLSTLARSWTPKGMRLGKDADDLLDALADALADSLNPLMDWVRYIPILLSPTLSRDEDIDRILALHGIDGSDPGLTNAQARRLAILGPTLKQWRGAFRAHRTVAGAITGGPVVVRSYLIQRYILGVSSFDEAPLLTEEDDADTTQMFVLGQGPQAVDYDEGQTSGFLDSLAKPVLDEIELVDCYALTAWRDGLAGWIASGEPVLIPSEVRFEYEGVDIGPAVDSTVAQFLASPTTKPATVVPETNWSTVWFKTNAATESASAFWEHHVYLDTSTFPTFDSYVVRVRTGNFGLTFHRVTASVYGPALGSHVVQISDGIDGSYHRLDLLVYKTSTNTRLRAYIDGDPTPWFDDTVVAGRPDGDRAVVSLRTSEFTAGRLRVAAITARVQA